MFDMKKFLALLATLALALLGITKADMFSPQLAELLSQPVTAKLSLLIGSAVAFAAIVLSMVYAYVSWIRTAASERERQLSERANERERQLSERANERERELSAQAKKLSEEREQKLLVKDQEIELLRGQLRDRDRLRLLDIVTGIPNQLKWEKDVENLSKTDDPDPHYQMIIIDLDNFREINRAFGYEKGDQVIKDFARSIFNTMRRDEHIYKNLIRGENDAPIKIEDRWERIYRKYTGGDEFLLTVNGDQKEALGFLVRLARDLLPQMNERISKFILESEVALSFHAGMCEWIQGDEPQDVLQRLEGTLRKAVNSSTSRLYFHPEKTSQEFEQEIVHSTGKPPRFNPYREAERLFAKSPH
jgi:GGDEF domain-containing protein